MKPETHRMSRKPTGETYDASVGLEPVRPGEVANFAYALVKLSYRVEAGRLALAEPEPLALDLYAEPPPEPRFPAGSDYWLFKRATDVVIEGAARAPRGVAVTQLDVDARIGPLRKRIAVFGRREIRWTASGQIAISSPEPFTEMSLSYANAYGGLDPRVPIAEDMRDAFLELCELGVAVDHPGLYPRNAIGKGYSVYPEPVSGLEMPNLEDPDDLLSAARLITGDPRRWYLQPLPWCFDWTQRLMYPRELLFGLDAWYPCPEPERLLEVKRGYVSREALEPVESRRIDPCEMYQEASLGLVARGSLVDHAVSISGMHAERPLFSFRVPPAPEIEIEVDGRFCSPPARLTNLVIRPNQEKVSLVWCVHTPELRRKFVPQVHEQIPLSVRVNGDAKIHYTSPPSVRERLRASGAASPRP
jgi:hypothetical protein